MDPVFATISRYFWVICLGVSYFNYAWANRQRESETLEQRRYLLVFAVAGILPWIVMGLGQLTGFTPTVWYYFRPQDKNPFVMAWLALIFVMAVTFATWVLFFGGAENVRKYNLLSAVGMRSAKVLPMWIVKLYAVAAPFLVLLWIYLAVSMDAKVPR